MAWFTPPPPPEDEYTVRCGMAADPFGRDLDYLMEREDRLAEMAPFMDWPLEEARVRDVLYGPRSGSVTPLGANRPPIDEIEEAA